MAQIRVADGWVKVPFTGRNLDQCFLSMGDSREPGEWRPAFKAYDGRRRVIQIRPHAAVGQVVIWQRINGTVTRVGMVRL